MDLNQAPFVNAPISDPSTGLPTALMAIWMRAIWNRTGQGQGASPFDAITIQALSPGDADGVTGEQISDLESLLIGLGVDSGSPIPDFNDLIVFASTMGAVSGDTGGLFVIPNNTFLANISGSVDLPVAVTQTAFFDSALGNIRGDLIYRGTANWAALPLGISGDILTSNGTDVLWAPPAVSPLAPIANNTFLANTAGGAAVPIATTETTFLDSAIGNSRGDLLCRGAANWAALMLPASGGMLRSDGTDATWAFKIAYPGDQSYQTSSWAPGNTVSTNTSLYTSATTQQATQREFLSGVFFTSNLGSGASSPQRDKVAFSTQLEAQAGSGDVWALYPVMVIDAGAMVTTGFTAFGAEFDLNNNALDLSSPTTIGGQTGQAYGVALTGSSPFTSTSAIWITGVNPSSVPQWDKGIWITGSDTIKSFSFRDESNSPTSLQILGTHNYGLDLANATFSTAPINWPTADTVSSATAGTNGALPLQVAGYAYMTVGGTPVVFPFYFPP